MTGNDIFYQPDAASIGEWCFALAKELWPIPRSITGPGVRNTLSIIKRELPNLQIYEVPSGEAAFDWIVPNEWTIRDAYIEDEQGNRVVDFQENNLHVVGYSTSVDTWLDLSELQLHLHSLPEQPNAIPYVVSYYRERWGFCLSDTQRKRLRAGRYRVFIDADLKPGVLNYGELLIEGENSQEIFLSTYVCHPSMANDNLSGMVVTTALVKWLQMQSNLRYSYRIVFIPETIGSLVYISRNLEEMRANVKAGFSVTFVGDSQSYSYLPSRKGDTLSDLVAQHVLKCIDRNYKRFTWLNRGSDERQYCAPGVDLPIALIMRSYSSYPEYHTSLDTLGEVVTEDGLAGGFHALQTALKIIELNFKPVVTTMGEPHLSKRGLYPDTSHKGSAANVRTMMNMISMSDGTKSLLEIAEIIDVPFMELFELSKPLVENGLLRLEY